MSANQLFKIGQFRPNVEIPFVADLKLAAGRTHEFCGSSRRTLALMLAGSLSGHLFWISCKHSKMHLNPEGVMTYVNPGRLVVVSPSTERDVLWCAEEVLRSGTAAVVVAELTEIPKMLIVRRLHLAAQTGIGTGVSSVGVILTPGGGSAQGVETRWHMSPLHVSGLLRWRLERRHSRGVAPMAWNLVRDLSGFRLVDTNLPSATVSSAGRWSIDKFESRTDEQSENVLKFPVLDPVR